MAPTPPSGVPASIELSDDDEERREREFKAARAANDRKAYNRFLEIFDKYARDFDGIGDEIDLLTGNIVVNNGHIQSMKDETDVGAEIEEDEDVQIDTRNRFVRALTVEPDLVILSESEDDVPMEDEGESEEDEIKCEACWESDQRHCPHINESKIETPVREKPILDMTIALDHSRLRQFGAELSAKKARPFKFHRGSRLLAKPDLLRSNTSSAIDTDDLMPSAVALEVLMNSTAAAVSGPKQPATSSTPATNGVLSDPLSPISKKMPVLVPQSSRRAEKSESAKPHKKMIHVFRLSEGKARKRSSRPRPVGKARAISAVSATESTILAGEDMTTVDS